MVSEATEGGCELSHSSRSEGGSMSDSSVVNSSQSVGSVSASSASAVVQGAAANRALASSGSSSDTFSSIGELQRKQPELYRLMTEGIFMSFSREQQHAQDRMKEILREGRQSGAF